MGASIMQIFGYAATGFGLSPLNIYLFLFGLIGWFVVAFYGMTRDYADSPGRTGIFAGRNGGLAKTSAE